MKRFTLLLLSFALILPGASVFAQDPPPLPAPPVSGQCDLFFWLDDFSQRLDTLQSLEDFGNLIMHVGQGIIDCGEEWLNMLPMLLMGEPLDDVDPPHPVIVDDGVLSPEEAESAVIAAFAEDLILANQYFCEAEAITAEDLANTPEDLELSSVKCARVNDQMICEAQLAYQGSVTPATLEFDIVDELLCGGGFIE